jgi:hypothetical protein
MESTAACEVSFLALGILPISNVANEGESRKGQFANTFVFNGWILGDVGKLGISGNKCGNSESAKADSPHRLGTLPNGGPRLFAAIP